MRFGRRPPLAVTSRIAAPLAVSTATLIMVGGLVITARSLAAV